MKMKAKLAAMATKNAAELDALEATAKRLQEEYEGEGMAMRAR